MKPIFTGWIDAPAEETDAWPKAKLRRDEPRRTTDVRSPSLALRLFGADRAVTPWRALTVRRHVSAAPDGPLVIAPDAALTAAQRRSPDEHHGQWPSFSRPASTRAVRP